MLVWRAYNRPRDSDSCHIWTLEIIHVGLSCMLIRSLSSRWAPPASKPVVLSLVFCVGSSSAYPVEPGPLLLQFLLPASCLCSCGGNPKESLFFFFFFFMELIFQWGKLDSCVSWRRMLSEDRHELKDLGTALFFLFFYVFCIFLFVCFILKI